MSRAIDISRFDKPGLYCQGKLSSKITKKDIEAILGFGPNVEDDPVKVKNSWGFKLNGEHCGIWDYKRSKWSVYGNLDLIEKLFGDGSIERY